MTAGGDAGEDHKAAEVALHQTLARYYEKRYGSKFSGIFQQFWNDEFVDLVPLGARGPVLDAGCGTGILLGDLVQRFEDVHGVDISPDMLARVSLKSPRLKEVKVGDIEATGYPDDYFGTIFCRGSLHHAASREKAFAEMSRVLKPGGYMALTEPSDDFFLVRWARAALYKASSHFDEHDRAFRLRDVRDCLEPVGMEIVAVKRFGYLSYLFSGFPDILPIMPYLPGQVAITRGLIKLDKILSRIPAIRVTSFHLMVLARHKASS
jgi:ubiquinone/menaquinone biosynthesis C-methylase UbiE